MAQTYPPISEAPAPKAGMSNTTKIILGILAVLGVCCIVSVIAVVAGGAFLGRQVEEAMVTDPAEAAETGRGIVDYDLPSGYEEQGAMSIFGMDMVFISEGGMDEESGMLIMLARFDIPGMDAADTDEMQSQMQQGFNSGSSSGGVTFDEVDSRDIVIDGEETTLSIAEGEDDNGNIVRQATAAFISRDKPAMVMIMGPADQWDEDAVEEFLTSLE